MVPVALRSCPERGRVGELVHSMWVEVHRPSGCVLGASINQLAAESLVEVGADMSGAGPKAIDPGLLRRVDLVITLGRDATVDVPAGVEVRNWDTDEPSERGLDGLERMRLIRDDIAQRVNTLLAEIAPSRA